MVMNSFHHEHIGFQSMRDIKWKNAKDSFISINKPHVWKLKCGLIEIFGNRKRFFTAMRYQWYPRSILFSFLFPPRYFFVFFMDLLFFFLLNFFLFVSLCFFFSLFLLLYQLSLFSVFMGYSLHNPHARVPRNKRCFYENEKLALAKWFD